MSKYQAIRTIRSEIARLNHEIDLRIIKGLSYREQSKRHKFLTSQLSRLHKTNSSWFSRSFGFVSSHMF